MSAEILDQIAKEVAACTKCPLSQGRCKAVPGEGSPDARVMFIGEGPGYHEDQQGRPFVGPSGQLLDQLFDKIKLKREDVFITNVVKCRPPGNRDPEPAEMEACKNYLDRQIAAVNPRLIITLGRISTVRFWPGQKIGMVHGQSKAEYGRMYMAMFHPSFALRDRFGPGMQKFKEDGLRIPAVMAKAEELAKTELWGFAKPDVELAPPMLPVVPFVAEKKPEYQPQPEEIENTAPETVIAATGVLPEPESQLVNGNGNNITAEVLAAENALQEASSPEAKPARRPRKPKEVSEPEVVPETQAEAEKPAPRRKKKENDVLAEQLTMF